MNKMAEIESKYIWVVDENGFGGEVLLKDHLNYLKAKKYQQKKLVLAELKRRVEVLS